MNLSAPQLLGHLRDARYAELETSLGTLQGQFERGEVGETELETAFKPFEASDPSLGGKFEEWMQSHPGSYVAHTALAEWLLARAWAFRGGTTMNLVSDQGQRGMHHFLEQAEACARHATTLTANPLLAWLIVANVHNTLGCRLDSEDVRAGRFQDWFTHPLRDNSYSLALRRAMLRHLRSEWGGSEEMMLTFVRQQQEAGELSPGDLQKLWAQYHAQVAHHAWMFARQPAKALEHARLAADLDESHTELLFGLVSDQKLDAATRRSALERYLTAAERRTKTGLHSLWYARAGLLQSIDVLPPYAARVATVLTRMADHGEHDATWELGALTHEAPHLGLPDPAPLLRRARDQGHVESAEMLVMLAQKARPHDPAQIRDHILKAADLGSSDMSWDVYTDFAAFREQFGLDERAKYRYLLRAADAGNNDARFALAQSLRAGRVEVGDDGVLRPVDTRPLQESLDYAKHLLERAAAENHPGAQKALKAAKDKDWAEGTARRIKAAAPAPAKPTKPAPPLRFPWFLALFLLFGLFRACASHSSTPELQAAQNVLESQMQAAQGNAVDERDFDQTLRELERKPLPNSFGEAKSTAP